MIPLNIEGAETNTESAAEFDSAAATHQFFLTAKQRLLNVNAWHDLAGKATAVFRLTDEHGNEVNRVVQQGDHLRISIPAPGPVTGEGFDWVKVEAIDEKENYLAIRVRPASNPLSDQRDVAHFFTDSATSSFIIKKEDLKVVAGVYGRNEKPNTDTEHTMDKIRNTAIATGAIAGFAKIQWKSLVNGFVSPV